MSSCQREVNDSEGKDGSNYQNNFTIIKHDILLMIKRRHNPNIWLFTLDLNVLFWSAFSVNLSDIFLKPVCFLSHGIKHIIILQSSVSIQFPAARVCRWIATENTDRVSHQPTNWAVDVEGASSCSAVCSLAKSCVRNQPTKQTTHPHDPGWM